MKKILGSGLLLFLLNFTSPAEAAFIDRGTGMIYDTDLKITWLQDANYAKTSGYDADGLMNWNQAVNWASQLYYGGYSNWRLPKTIDGKYVFGFDGTTTAGYNITTSELGHLYYKSLGNLGYYDVNGKFQQGWGSNNKGPFINVQFPEYWSGTEYSYNPEFAWSFLSIYGGQGIDGKVFNGLDKYAWAVRDGDYGPSVSTTHSFTTDLLTLGDTFSFDVFWEMGIEPDKFNFDILYFHDGKWKFLRWDLNFDGSSDDWKTLTFVVPEWARGLQTQIKFSLFDFGQETDPTVYLRNIHSAAVPEPTTILLFAFGLTTLAGFSRSLKKKGELK